MEKIRRHKEALQTIVAGVEEFKRGIEQEKLEKGETVDEVKSGLLYFAKRNQNETKTQRNETKTNRNQSKTKQKPNQTKSKRSQSEMKPKRNETKAKRILSG